MNGTIGPGGFVLGALLLAVELAAAATASLLIVRRRAAHLRGSARAVALCLLGLGGVIAMQVVPLALGVLTRGTVLLAALVLALAASRVPAAAPPPEDRPLPLELRWRLGADSLSWLLAGAGVLLFAAFTVAYLELNLTVPVESVDALGFHLPGVIRFIQSGTLWQTAQYLPGQAQGNYPQSGDMLLLALALPWHSLAFVRLADPLLLALAALAVYGIGRELAAPAPSAVLAALALIAIRPTLGPALTDVLTDPAFLAGFAAGALFLLRHWRTGVLSDLVLSGLGFGLALGSKWYGLTDVPALVAVWIAAGLISGRGRGRVARQAAGLIAVIALAGGVWLLRNLILTGNPVFDYQLRLFGVTILSAPPDPLRRELGFTLAHYLGDPGVLRRYVWPVLRSDFGLTGGLIVGAALLTAALSLAGRLREGAQRSVVAGLRRRPDAPDAQLGILLAAALLAAIAYSVTPYSAQGFAGAPVLVNANTRYGAPALLLAAPVLAFVAGRLWRLRVALEALLLALVIVDLRRYLVSGAGRIALSAVGLAALAAAVAILLTRRPRLRARALPALAAALACGLALLLYHYQRVLARRPYAPSDPTVDYVLASAPASARIGIAGQWTAQGLVPVAPLFGARLQNHVTYVGPWIDHRLEQYVTEAGFLSALRAGGYDLLEVGTGFPPSPDPPQVRWAAAAGYRPVASSARLILLRRAGARPGSSCCSARAPEPRPAGGRRALRGAVARDELR